MKRFLLLLLVIAALQCHAQPAYLGFDRLDVQNGLPENNVQDILQDSQGYIWLTTQNGMVRYDGYNVKIYKPGSEDKSNLTYTFYKIVQDKNHDIWVCGGNTGLFKYDRTTDRFVQYKNKDAAEKGFLLLQGIDAGGKIWIGIAKGNDNSFNWLQQFDPVTGIFKTYGRDQKGAHHLTTNIANTYFDDGGQLWLETDNGCYLYNPAADSFKGYLTSAEPLQQKKIDMIYQAPSAPGELWIAAEDKKQKHGYLLLMNKQSGQTEKFEHLAGNNNSLGSDTVYTAFEDSRRRLWLGTNAGLSLYHPISHSFTNYQPADTIKNNNKYEVTQIIADKGGLLWLASASPSQVLGFGALCFNPQTGLFKRYMHDKNDPNSLTNDYISKLMFDRDGILWLAGYFGGAQWVNPAKSAFTAFKGAAGKLPWHNIYQVTEAPDKTWWVGARNGFYHYDPLKQNAKLIDKAHSAVSYVARDGLVYYAFYDPLKADMGLRVFDPKTGKTAQYQANAKDNTTLSNNQISYILQDHTGIVWIGTHAGGICAFNPLTKKFKRYPFIVNDNAMVSHNELDDIDVEAIYEDRAGTVWVGTNHGGVNHYDRSKDIFISSYKPAEGVFCVCSFNQDREGRLWAGTYMNGLFLLDDHTGAPLKRLAQKDGLLTDQTDRNVIHNGSGDFIWVCMPRGFSRINTRDFSIKNYKSVDNNWAMIDAQMHDQSTDREGNIIFWKNDDIALFNPNALNMDANAPLVHIENMAYSDPRATNDTSVIIQRFGQTQKELPWNQDKITFNYVALHYVDAAENKYAYRLEGYDNHWVQAGTQHSVTYTNLAPGTYTFHVKAANSDGVWNNKGDSFIVVINSPWWKTWWAWALWVISFGSAVYAFIAYRSRKLMEDKRILEETVQARTTEAMEQKEELLQQKEEIEAQAAEAQKQASLDRVRAEIASMRSTSDLERITPLMWTELNVLEVPFTRCGVFIVDEQHEEIHTYLSTPGGEALASYPISFNSEGLGNDILSNWRKQQAYTDHWGEEQFRAYSQNLVEQGAVESQGKYLAALPTASLYLHFVPFLQGMLYVGNIAPLSDGEMHTVQLLAEAFSTAYARYEDFSKLEAAKQQVDNTLTELKSAQTQLIQNEKMASLGELTAGIAHEIQNPLNFVNNFSEVSVELLAELKEEAKAGHTDDIIAIADDLSGNLEKIRHHGRRADGIVKGMLEHSRASTGQKEPTDLNKLADEYLRLAYHGLRAKDKSFNAELVTRFDEKLPLISVIPQDIGRVLLNLFNNAFYAVNQKAKTAGADYKPTVEVSTSQQNGSVVFTVKDNGNGIPNAIKDKIMQPFFTTKPTGEGTGLGLSLSYDIVVKGHGGSIDVRTKENEFTNFIVTLPIN